jgi:hypothetical protein
VAVTDQATWSQVARQTAGAFAAWSNREQVVGEDVDNAVEEQLSTAARTAFVAASQVAQMMMSKRQQEARAAVGAAEAEGRELTGRFDAELVAAEAHLQQSHDQQWWATASVEDIGQMYGTAEAWSEYSPVAASAAAMMQAEVRSRYGAEIKDLLDEAATDHPGRRRAADARAAGPRGGRPACSWRAGICRGRSHRGIR